MQVEDLKRILIVEDDLALKPIWHELFADIPAQIVWAVSYEESLKIIEQMQRKKENFDLLITDIFLAGSGTGIELLTSDSVKSSPTKTILISVVDKSEIIHEYGHLLPKTHILTKPLKIVPSRKLVRSILFNE